MGPGKNKGPPTATELGCARGHANRRPATPHAQSQPARSNWQRTTPGTGPTNAIGQAQSSLLIRLPEQFPCDDVAQARNRHLPDAYCV